jgi:ribosomal protein S18 acetylase RimI-like enzyme
MKIRTYRETDEEAVIALWERTGISRPWIDLREEIREKRKRDPMLFLVAGEDRPRGTSGPGVVLGAVMGAFDGRRGWVYHLAVEPGRQSQGIGRALMAELEDRMARQGVFKINLQVRNENGAVRGFYEHLGYVDDQVTSFGKWLRPNPLAPGHGGECADGQS